MLKTFGWRVQAFAVYDCDGSLIAWLPFVRKRRLLRRFHVCLPLSHCVGFAHRGDLPRLPLDLSGLWPLEIHRKPEVPSLQQSCKHYATHIDLKTASTPDELLNRCHKNHIQRKISKAKNAGLTVRIGTTPEDFESFHNLQVETRRRQGSPMYPKGFFRSMHNEFSSGDQVRLHLVYLGNDAVAAVVFFRFDRTSIYAYGASRDDRDVWRLGANQLAMWSAIKEAYELGHEFIDLGSTPIHQSSLREYKEHWGGESKPLIYSFSGVTAESLQIERTSNPVRIAEAVLRRVPLALYDSLTSPLLKIVV